MSTDWKTELYQNADAIGALPLCPACTTRHDGPCLVAAAESVGVRAPPTSPAPDPQSEPAEVVGQPPPWKDWLAGATWESAGAAFFAWWMRQPRCERCAAQTERGYPCRCDDCPDGDEPVPPEAHPPLDVPYPTCLAPTQHSATCRCGNGSPAVLPGPISGVLERLGALEARVEMLHSAMDGWTDVALAQSRQLTALEERLVEVERTQLAQHERERLGPVARPLGVHHEALAERARIVEWLRAFGTRDRDWLAGAIERDEHWEDP